MHYSRLINSVEYLVIKSINELIITDSLFPGTLSGNPLRKLPANNHRDLDPFRQTFPGTLSRRSFPRTLLFSRVKIVENHGEIIKHRLETIKIHSKSSRNLQKSKKRYIQKHCRDIHCHILSDKWVAIWMLLFGVRHITVTDQCWLKKIHGEGSACFRWPYCSRRRRSWCGRRECRGR